MPPPRGLWPTVSWGVSWRPEPRDPPLRPEPKPICGRPPPSTCCHPVVTVQAHDKRVLRALCTKSAVSDTTIWKYLFFLKVCYQARRMLCTQAATRQFITGILARELFWESADMKKAFRVVGGLEVGSGKPYPMFSPVCTLFTCFAHTPPKTVPKAAEKYLGGFGRALSFFAILLLRPALNRRYHAHKYLLPLC